jgi:hypothetical protein
MKMNFSVIEPTQTYKVVVPGYSTPFPKFPGKSRLCLQLPQKVHGSVRPKNPLGGAFKPPFQPKWAFAQD